MRNIATLTVGTHYWEDLKWSRFLSVLCLSLLCIAHSGKKEQYVNFIFPTNFPQLWRTTINWIPSVYRKCVPGDKGSADVAHSDVDQDQSDRPRHRRHHHVLRRVAARLRRIHLTSCPRWKIGIPIWPW